MAACNDALERLMIIDTVGDTICMTVYSYTLSLTPVVFS